MYSSSTRTRSGSVGRGERDPIPYRTSYGKDVTSSIPSRYSRASSYDPFSSRLPKSPSMSSSYNRPSYSSVSSTPMSHSYHTDYTPRPLTTRYGSTDQLSSASSYKSPYSSGMSSSYRTPDHTSSYRERPTYRASSTFTPRTSSYSDSRPSRDLPPVVRDYSSSNLSKYRPDVSTSYSRPSYTSTSSYTPRGRYEYRSKTPGVTSNYGSTVSSSGTGGRFDRDCKSMTRFEKTTKPEKQEESTDDVEATFQKLYNRYVKDIESDTEPEKPKQEKPVYTRKFISHSEAEEETSEEEESPYEDDSFAEQLRIREANQKKPASLTPRESSCDVTPQASPLPKKKVQIDDVKTIPGPLVKTEPEKKEIPQKKEAVPTRIEPSSTASPAQRFKEQHHDVEMKPAVIAARDLKPAASAMDKMLRRDSLTTKLTEAMVKKKSPTPTPKDSVAAPTVKAASPLSTTSKTVPPQAAQPKSRSATPTLPKQPSTSKPVTTTDASGKPATKGQEAAGSSSASAPVKPVSKPAGPATPALKPTEVKRAVTPEVKKAVQPEVKKTPPQEIRKAVTPERGTSTSKSLTPSKSSSPLPDSKKVTESKNAPKPVAPLFTLPVTKTDSGSRSKSPAKDSVSTAPKDVKTTTRESSPGVSVKKTAEPPVKVDNSKEKLKTRSPSPKPPVTQTKPKEPTSDVTITLPQSIRSRSSSPAARKPRDRSKSRGERGETPQFLTVNPSSSRKTRDGSPSKMRRSASPTSQIELERDDRSKSVGEAAEKTASLRKRRDPTRTLDNLKETLEPLLQQKRKEMEQSATEASEAKETIAELPSTCRPPLLLVTQPSMPSTPRLSSAGIDWDVSNSEGEWTEAEDEQEYESDYEYSISQTFKIRERLPLGDLYPISPPSSRCSPFVSDYDSDSIMPFMVTQSREEDSRGRVDRLFAVPPPTFTCSVTYDGQESWDSDDSVHSCEDDFDDAYTGACPRGGSSSLGFYLSPATYSTEDDSLYQDSVDVGCTLKLVDRMAMRDSDDEYTDDSEYYDDEYSDEEYYDEDEEYEYEEEEYEEEYEEEEEEEEEEMLSFAEEDEKSLSPMITQSAAMEEGEEMVFEEMDDHFEEVAPFHSAVSEEVAAESTAADKHREITYTKDVQLKHEEEITGQLELEKNEKAKAVAKKITKDGKSGKVEKHMVTQQVAPAHELIAEASTEVLPEEEMIGLDLQEHLENTGTREVNVVPTYVRPSTEKVEQESASRFSEKKPTTDFAKKAVIQPNKLETVKVNKTETKLATVKPKEEEKPNATAKPAPELKSTESKTSSVIKKEPTKPEELKTDTGTSAKKLGAPETKPSATAQAETVKSSKEAEDKTGTLRKDVTSKTPEATKKTKAEERMEDKSGIRKSALNMTAEEAKKKAKMDEEAAKQKARRLGTVSALMNRFKDEPKEPEPVLYKRSSRLTQRDEEKPKRKYEIVKPVLNDEFDKQMEEIRAQMKAGSSQFQTELKSLSKGISTVTEETKKRELEEKHKSRLDKASGVFSKADEEKMRWKEKRDAETDKELTKIEAAKGHKTKVVTAPEPAPQEPKKEPKRTIRKINRNKSPAVEAESEAFKPTTSTPAPSAVKDSTSIKTIPTGKVEPVAVPQTASDKKIPTAPVPPTAPPAPLQRDMFKREKTPVVKPADSLQKPSAPKADLVIDDSNFALFAAATAVATRKKRMPWEPKIKKEAEKSEEDKTVPTRKTSVPKGDGAAATKIRNAMGNMANSAEKGAAGHEKSSRRYSTRRKTQEIVNESVQPKRRRKDKSRRNRFIRDPHDIDIILGWEKENTFELMERMFAQAANDKIQYPSSAKKRRLQSSKIWISELTDIDKIYKQSEIRDIAASVHG